MQLLTKSLQGEMTAANRCEYEKAAENECKWKRGNRKLKTKYFKNKRRGVRA